MRRATDRQTARKTFCQILTDLRHDAAETAWQRAVLASRLRHVAANSGRRRAARRLGEIKQRAIERVIELLPRDIVVTVDDDRLVGLLSVRWNGHGRLHLPAAALATTAATPPARAAG